MYIYTYYILSNNRKANAESLNIVKVIGRQVREAAPRVEYK